MALSLPPPTQPLTKEDFVTEPWYRVLTEIGRLRVDVDNIFRLLQGQGAADMSATFTVSFIGSE